MMLPPGTQSRARLAWWELARTDPDNRETSILRNPVLLRPEVVEWLAAQAYSVQIDEVQPDVQPTEAELAAALTAVRELATTLQDRLYPLGEGPVEQLWRDLHQGVRTLEQAITAARALPLTESLTAPYVDSLLGWLARPGMTREQWRQSWERGRVLVAALDACDRRQEPALQFASRRGIVKWSQALLSVVPDGAVLADGDAAGQEWIATAIASGVPGYVRDAEYAVAAMWTDPYTAGRSTANYHAGQQDWLKVGWEEHTVADGRSTESWAMPEPAVALQNALVHWRAARDVAPDSPVVLIGLAEAGLFLRAVTGESLLPEVIDAIKHGLDVTPETETHLRSRFEGVAPLAGVDVNRTTVDRRASLVLASAESDSLVAELGPEAAIVLSNAIEQLAVTDPAGLLDVVERHRELLTEGDRLGHSAFTVLWQRVILALNSVHGIELDVDTTDAESFQRSAGGLLAGLPDDCSPECFAAAALQLAKMSLGPSAEDFGLTIISAARSAAPYLTKRYSWAIDALTAELLTGLGVNAKVRNDFAAALRWYSRSFTAWLPLGRPAPLRTLMEWLGSIAQKADEEAVIEVVGTMINNAPVLLTRLGPTMDWALSELLRRFVGSLCESGHPNSEVMWALLQFGKGLRTAMELDRPTAPDLGSDPRLAELNDQLTTVGQESPRLVDNLRKAFEVRRRELLRTGLTTPDLLTLKQARLSLDSRSVLLSTADLVDRAGRPRRMAYAIWDSEQSIALTATDAGPGIALPVLPNTMGGELAGLHDAGKDHLCIVPDGDGFDLPWHRLGDDEWRLADDWIVTLLPHPHLLFGSRGRAFVRRTVSPILAVGLDRADPVFGLQTLPDAQDEAAAIAAHWGMQAVVGEQATVQRVVRLLPTARYVHIATHGLFDPDHPAFHSLVLAGGPAATLTAWQVAELDLNSVRVVTLSACDSARMAAQPGDNVDGLPIAFLSAGARAVVGTSSEVASGVTRLFFEQFYAGIAAGDVDGTADLRDVFQSAQQATRAAFPDPAHWSAFYFLGDWR